jgi:phospholipid/cholesterol/gamma-HCH transport system permease protein
MAAMSDVRPSPPEWHLERNGRVAALRLSGDWIACETGVRSADEARRILDDAAASLVRVDASNLGKWDSALISFLRMLRDASVAGRAQPIQIDDSGLPNTARQLLALAVAGDTQAVVERMPHPSLPTRVGLAFFNAVSRGSEVVELVGETALRGVAGLTGRTHTRAADIFQLVREAGAGALGIVAIVNGLIGAILAFVGAVELQRFGAGIYVADLVGITVAREMAAIGTGIVMAGRTGGAYAAHLATMQGNEEIDALNALGIRVFDFLILPRVVALITMMPLLYLYACAVGFFGGFVVSVATLDIAPALFFEQLRAAVGLRQFEIGLVKSIAFGALIALAGCHIGLRAGRSAADVGRAATTAVVASIVGIIALDAVFALCCDALGI